ncbi:MAG: hypothetical protein ACR2PA_01295, partial [Hyphomicrobiaceae bacterium]
MTDQANKRPVSTRLLMIADDTNTQSSLGAPVYQPLPLARGAQVSMHLADADDDTDQFRGTGPIKVAHRDVLPIAGVSEEIAVRGTFAGFSVGLFAGVASGTMLMLSLVTSVGANRVELADFSPEPFVVGELPSTKSADGAASNGRISVDGRLAAPQFIRGSSASVAGDGSSSTPVVARFAVAGLKLDRPAESTMSELNIAGEFGSQMGQSRPVLSSTPDTRPLAHPLLAEPTDTAPPNGQAAIAVAATQQRVSPIENAAAAGDTDAPASKSGAGKSVAKPAKTAKIVRRRFKPASRG